MRIFLSAPIIKGGDIDLFDRVGAKNRLLAFPIMELLAGKKIDVDSIIKDCRKVKGQGERLMYDSGVATLNATYLKKNRRLLEEGRGLVFPVKKFREVIDTYCDVVRAIDQAGAADCFLEMDVDHIMGIEEVLRVRRRLAQATSKLVPVWRSSQGSREYDRVTREFSYVAFSLIGAWKQRAGWAQLLYEAYRREVKVHLFAWVRPEQLLSMPCYSTDSSSWTKGRRWGIVNYNSDRTGKMMGGRVAEGGESCFKDPSFLGLSKKTAFSPMDKDWVLEAAVRDYIELEKRVTRVWEKRGYAYEA